MNSKTRLRKIRHNFLSLLLTAPSPFLCSVLVTCSSHHFFILLYFAFIEFATITQHADRDKMDLRP